MTGSPMMLLMTADAVGGVWQYSLELARVLAAHGVRTLLAVMGPPPSVSQLAGAAAVPGLSLQTGDFPLEWMPEAAQRDLDAAGEWLLGLAHRYRVDGIHLNGYAHAVLPWPAPALSAAHSCVLTWWQAVYGEDAPAEWDAYRVRVQAGLAAAASVVAPSAALLKDMERLYGALPHGIVIRNGIDGGPFAPAGKAPFVLAAGRVWDPAKNSIALDAVASRISWPVRIAGCPNSPDGGSTMLSGAQPLGVLASAQLREQMARAAIFAAPARYEPFGLAILEAALCECALVLGDIASLRELWDGAAVFVAPDDHWALAAAIEGLIANPARRSRLGRLAGVRARRYSAGRMAAGYMRLYRELGIVRQAA